MSTPSVALIDPEQLRVIVREELTDALAAAAGAPRLLDRAGLARALSCSPSHVDVLRRRGLPVVKLGAGAPRFDLAEALTWIRSGAV